MKILFITLLVLCILDASLAAIYSLPLQKCDTELGTICNKTRAERLEEFAQSFEKQDKCQAAFQYDYAANAYKELNNTAKSIEMLNKVAILFETVSEQDQLSNPDCIVPWAHERAAEVYRKLGNTVKSTELYTLAAQEYEQKATQEETCKFHDAPSYYKNAAYCYNEAGNTSKSIEMLEKASDIYSKTRNINKFIEMVEKEADIKYQSGDYMKASSLYSEAVHAYKTIKITGIFKKAAPVFEQAAIKHQAEGDYTRAVWHYKYAADAYRDMGNNTAKANELYTLAAQEFEKHNMQLPNNYAPGDAGVFYVEAADLYRQLGDQTKAAEMQSRADALPKSK